MVLLPGTPPARFLSLILGPKAARDPAIRRAVEGLRVSGHEVEVHLTWEAGDASRFARMAVDDELDAVVAAGGDGTLNEVVNGVVGAGGPQSIGVLPYGTANDFATAAGLVPDSPAAALRTLTRGELRSVDLAKVADRCFVNMATAGPGAEITTETPGEVKRRLGGLSYLVNGLARATQLEASEVRLRAPDFEWRGRAYAVAVGNGRQAGGGLRLCPRARLDDGLLDLMVLPEMPVDELLPWLGESFLSGRFVDFQSTLYRQVPWLEMESPEDIQLNLDGEPVRGRNFRFEVERGRLPMFLPSSDLFV
ncbi:MAG: lipid kinase YegS [Acidobacteriota bacterium]